MEKVFLFLIDYLPPFLSANGICANYVMNEVRKKYKCYSISFSNVGFEHTEYKYHIPERRWSRILKKMQCLKKERKIFSYFLLRIFIMIKRVIMLPFWPVISFSTVINFYKQSALLVKEKGITHIVAVSYPGESLLALVLLKIRFQKDVKLVMYPLDVTLGGKFNGCKLEKKISIMTCKIYFRICALFVDKIIVLENTLDLYKKSLPASIWHKFEICGIPLIVNQKNKKVYSKVNTLQLVYGGNIDLSVRNPLPFLSYLEKQSNQHSIDVCVDIYGKMEPMLQKKMEQDYKRIKIVNHGWVDESVLNQAIENASALISFGNNVSHLIPSKIFKYMSQNKPIIHLFTIKDDPCIPYLKKYGHSLLLNCNMLDVEHDFFEWIYDNQNFYVDSQSLFPKCTPAYTSNVITEF